MQSFMVDAFDRVAAEASHLTRHGKHKTLTAREVQASGRGPAAGAGRLAAMHPYGCEQRCGRRARAAAAAGH